MKYQSLIYPIAFALLWSCQNEPVQDWYIGTYQLQDQTIPHPELLTTLDNTGFLYDHYGKLIESCKLYTAVFQKRDTLDFGDKSYRVCHINGESLSIYDIKDTIKFYKTKDGSMISKNRAWFEKLNVYDLPNATDIESNLETVVWNYITYDETPNNDLTIDHLVSLDGGQFRHIRSYSYEGLALWSEIENKSYTIFEKEKHRFLSIIDDDKENPQPMLQITNVTVNNIELINFSDLPRRNESLIAKGMTNEEFNSLATIAIPYQNCSDGYVGEYYFHNSTYQKGNEFIKRWVSQDLPESNENGSIIVHYNINCEGEVGRYGMQSMDTNFEGILFSKEIVAHIMTKVSQLDDWPVIENEYWWTRHRDVHGFLMFNIRKGKIVDVCL